ncbi:hypothetical protein KM043_012123 [Ampulex compressa]|nr:hypothetical protein KM043_012123 [Ampulex compressa]
MEQKEEEAERCRWGGGGRKEADPAMGVFSGSISSGADSLRSPTSFPGLPPERRSWLKISHTEPGNHPRGPSATLSSDADELFFAALDGPDVTEMDSNGADARLFECRGRTGRAARRSFAKGFDEDVEGYWPESTRVMLARISERWQRTLMISPRFSGAGQSRSARVRRLAITTLWPGLGRLVGLLMKRRTEAGPWKEGIERRNQWNDALLKFPCEKERRPQDA